MKYIVSVVIIIIVIYIGINFYSMPKTNEDIEKSFVSILPPVDIMSLEVYEDELYAGSTEGVYKLVQDDHIYSLEKIVFDHELSYIRCMIVDTSNQLWIASSNGVALMKSDGQVEYYTKDNILPDNRVNTIYETKEGNIWIGTWSGAICINKEKEVIQELNVSSGLLKNMVNIIFEDDFGGIFFANYNERGGGINYLKDGQFSYFGEKELANINNTSYLLLDNGQIWFGEGMLDQGGMTILEHTNNSWEVVQILEKKDGLIGEKVRSLFIYNKDIYIGSEYDGVAVFKKSGEKIYYTKNNGLPNNEVKCYESFQEKLFFGSKNGLCYLIEK